MDTLTLGYGIVPVELAYGAHVELAHRPEWENLTLGYGIVRARRTYRHVINLARTASDRI